MFTHSDRSLVHRDTPPNSPLQRRSESRSRRRLELDEANHQLFTIENRMQRACAENRGEAESRVAIHELIEYAEKHFAREEELMRVFGYPGYAEHRAIHARLVNDIRLIKSQFIARSLGGAPATAVLIEQIIAHLKTSRLDYGAVRSYARRGPEEPLDAYPLAG